MCYLITSEQSAQTLAIWLMLTICSLKQGGMKKIISRQVKPDQCGRKQSQHKHWILPVSLAGQLVFSLFLCRLATIRRQ